MMEIKAELLQQFVIFLRKNPLGLTSGGAGFNIINRLLENLKNGKYTHLL